MDHKNTAEIPDRPSDSNSALNEFVPQWKDGTGKKFNGRFPPIPDVRNIDRSSIVSLMLPKTVCAMVGSETRIYFKNLVLAYEKSLLNFSAVCEIGENTDSYWFATPEKPGEYPLKITVKDSAGRIVGEAETLVRAALPENGNDRNLVVMIVGDSIMGNGIIADFLLEGVAARGNPNLRLMGSHSGQGAPLAVGKAAVEAYGGWSWDTFMTLWNPGDEYNKRTKFMRMENGSLVDAFQEYLDKYNNGKAPDIVIFSLGCNDIACADMGTIGSAVEKSVKARDQLISKFRSVMPDTLFGIVLLAPPNISEKAFEINYKGAIPRRQYLYNQFSYVRRTMEDLQDNPEFSLIPIYIGVDEELDYPENNAVHPNENGQKRFALMLENWLKNLDYSNL